MDCDVCNATNVACQEVERCLGDNQSVCAYCMFAYGGSGASMERYISNCFNALESKIREAINEQKN